MIEIEKKILDAFYKLYKKCKNDRANSKLLMISQDSLIYTNEYEFIKLKFKDAKIDIPVNANFDLSDFDKLVKANNNYIIQDYLLDYGAFYPDQALSQVIDKLTDDRNINCLYYLNDLRFLFEFIYAVINTTTAKKENVKVKYNLSNGREPSLFLVESENFKIYAGVMPVMR